MRRPRFSPSSTLSIAFSGVERGFKEGLSFTAFKADDERKVINFFFPDGVERCVFCGAKAPQRWDHLVPINEGGESVIGNIVPACQPCDDSKQHKNFEVWMLGGSPQSPRIRNIPDLDKRIAKLKEYAKFFGYVPRPVLQRLTSEEVKQFHELLKRLRDIRQDINLFITSFRDNHS